MSSSGSRSESFERNSLSENPSYLLLQKKTDQEREVESSTPSSSETGSGSVQTPPWGRFLLTTGRDGGTSRNKEEGHRRVPEQVLDVRLDSEVYQFTFPISTSSSFWFPVTGRPTTYPVIPDRWVWVNLYGTDGGLGLNDPMENNLFCL